MSTESSFPRVRLWPGVTFVTLQWLIRFGLPIVAPDQTLYAMIGGIGAGALVLLWWLFFSRLPWSERLGGLAIAAAALIAGKVLLDPSVAGAGMGMFYWILVVPGICLALVAWAVFSTRLHGALRLGMLALFLFAASAFWSLLRTDGIYAEGKSQLAWRWSKTAEQTLLARVEAEPTASPAPLKVEAPAAPAVTPVVSTKTVTPKTHPPALWPGFRGLHRDDVITGLKIATDWTADPPKELWRRAVGPAWSSFAVGGDGLIYTQEQRGDFEVVSCYKASSGVPVWTHKDKARFYESNGGPGPRATPTLHEGVVYTMGATGILNALDAATGAVLWTRNAAADTETKLPGWGFAGSPLIVDDVVVVAAAAHLIAYDRATGNKKWMGPKEPGGNYSSPQLLTIGGIPQIVIIACTATIGISPADGKLLWRHPWGDGAAILQPTQTPDGSLIVSSADTTGSMGTRRIAVAQNGSEWTAKELWTSRGLKPYFSDIVIHKGHAFGFDGSILSCIDLQDGARKWKGGRYGQGQLVLLADQDLLLVISEEGELALVSATPDQFKEIAKVPALDGKTWNHLVVAGTTLFVRNGQEMIAYRLPGA